MHLASPWSVVSVEKTPTAVSGLAPPDWASSFKIFAAGKTSRPFGGVRPPEPRRMPLEPRTTVPRRLSFSRTAGSRTTSCLFFTIEACSAAIAGMIERQRSRRCSSKTIGGRSGATESTATITTIRPRMRRSDLRRGRRRSCLAAPAGRKWRPARATSSCCPSGPAIAGSRRAWISSSSALTHGTAVGYLPRRADRGDDSAHAVSPMSGVRPGHRGAWSADVVMAKVLAAPAWSQRPWADRRTASFRRSHAELRARQVEAGGYRTARWRPRASRR